MNEQQFGRQIRKVLDQGLPLDDVTAARLRAVRESALEHHHAAGHSTVGAWALQVAGPGSVGPRSLVSRVLVPAAILSVGLVVVNYWYQSQVSQDLAQIDAAVLTGDLPIDAYLDTGFNAWLKRSSAE